MAQQDSSSTLRPLTASEEDLLRKQDLRKVSEFRAAKFQSESRKHWDIFYKRNGDKFFKDRHWTTREFTELAQHSQTAGGSEGSEEEERRPRHLLEVGCGVGNFCLPLLAEPDLNLRVSACDFSQRAVDILKENGSQFGDRLRAFQCDISESVPSEEDPADLLSLVFVLSALKPEAFVQALRNLFRSLKPGGALLFRDYAQNDMAMIRFGAGTKIRDRMYLRQDGTTSYFFSMEEVSELASEAGFQVKEVCYINRETVNKKEGIQVPRIFVQAVLTKPK